jgi:lysyl-tRNA synthetase class 2
MIINARILNRRRHGRAAFLDVLSNGENVQTYINASIEGFDEIVSLPLGTFIQCDGDYFITRTGHNTFRIDSYSVLHVPIRSIPVIQDDGESRYNDITDPESRRRRRYLQTILDPSERETFILRSRIISRIREFLISRNYLEVETPILQPIYGGAEATPFTTHFESLDMECFLRIAPELYLRRMIIGGYDRVFEIGHNFRNEGISNRHNPEFTFLELYTAFENYRFSMDLLEEMMRFIFSDIPVVNYQENEIRMHEISRIRYYEFVESIVGDISNLSESDIISIFEENEHRIIQPTIVYDYPSSISPLALRSPNPNISERFEFYIGGMEIGNAYSELNDVDQHIQNLGNEDSDFIEALSYGMPPTTGIGIGIDRLIMLVTNRNIRDVIFFPMMRRNEIS